jgi:type I restriction enzyme S subunit
MLSGGLDMALIKYKLGDLIKQRREKYDGLEELPIKGVAREGFISPKQDGADLSIYNVYYLNDFVFNPARMELNSIALNTFWGKAICSSLYEIFYITRTDLLLPEYLNLFIKRDEFARKCWFEAVGSARNYFRVADLSEFDIELPDIPTQQKYVDIYKAMAANQQSYERGLEDLKLTFEGYMDTLRHQHNPKLIGEYLGLVETTNESLRYGIDDVMGVSIEKKFIPTKADMIGVNLKPYYVIQPNEFAYVTVTSRNGEKISIALNDSNDTYICSSSYVVFKSKDVEKLWPQYLMLYFMRSEFNRYARFCSWGSARETFDWSEMQEVEIPIPEISIQKSIANIYNVYIKRKQINEQLKAQIKDICPILIRGSLKEGE